MSSPLKKESNWRTNRRTKRPFYNPLGSDLDRGRSRVEEEPVEDVQEDSPDDFYTCFICQEEKRKSETPYVMNPSGQPACQTCLRDAKSGRIQEEAYQRAQQYTAPVSPSVVGHVSKGFCPGCHAPHQRSLCDHCGLCYNCRAPSCPRYGR